MRDNQQKINNNAFNDSAEEFESIDLDGGAEYAENGQEYPDDGNYADDDYDAPRRLPILHFAILGIIAVLVIAGVVKLILWNRGSDSGFDPNAVDTESVSVEVQDFIVPMTADKLAGHEDDGVTTILLLGGNPVTDDLSETGIAAQIEKLAAETLEAEAAEAGNQSKENQKDTDGSSAQPVRVIPAAFPNARVTCLSREYDPSTQEGREDIYNFFYVAYSISSGNFDGQNFVATTREEPVYTESAQALTNLDYNDVDIIAVMYDDSDYRTLAPAYNGDTTDLSSFAGSLKSGIRMIQEAYPHIRIVFLSPTYRPYIDEKGNEQNPATTDLGNGEVVGYNAYAYMMCSETGISYIDNFSGSVNALNYERFVDKDGRLNEDGRYEVAKHFVTKIIADDLSEYRPPAAIIN